MLGNDQKQNMTARSFLEEFCERTLGKEGVCVSAVRVSHVVMVAQLAPCAGGALLHY